MLECVINVSEGRDADLLASLAETAGHVLLDVHRDADHHRSVFTLGGSAPDVEAGARRLTAAAVAALDLRSHQGVHPRLGTVDVVPWIALARAPGDGAPGDGARLADARLVDGDLAAAVAARDRFARWAAGELRVPCFLYGPSSPDPDLAWQPPQPRTLPELRRRAWRPWPPDLPPAGPGRDAPDRRAGSICVGARPVLVAYNLWLADPDLAAARRLAADLRSPAVRALGLEVGSRVQVSCNLVDPWTFGPAAAYDAVSARAAVGRAELVGLVPRAVLDAIPPGRWAELDLSPDRTIEARLAAGLDGGRR